MKTLIAFVLCSLNFSASAAATCPSVDRVIANAARGIIEYNSDFDVSAPAAIAYANVCKVESNQVLKGSCGLRAALWTQIVNSLEHSWRVGEVTREIMDAAKKSLAEAEACAK